MTVDQNKVLSAARLLIRQGIGHTAYEVPQNATADEIAIANAVYEKVLELERQGYTLPLLEKPRHMPDGSLLFGTDLPDIERRATTLFKSQAIEDWEFIDDDDDQKVTGRVTSIEPSKYSFLFTVTPTEGS